MSQIVTVTAPRVPLAWTTKNGKTRAAHTATAQLSAPKALQIVAAQSADVALMLAGTFAPFLRDLQSKLTGPQLAGLMHAVTRGMTRTIDGVEVVPANVTTALQSPNKAVALACAAWAAAPYTLKAKKGADDVLTPIAKPGPQLGRLLEVLVLWQTAVQQQEAAKTARGEAREIVSQWRDGCVTFAEMAGALATYIAAGLLGEVDAPAIGLNSGEWSDVEAEAAPVEAEATEATEAEATEATEAEAEAEAEAAPVEAVEAEPALL